MSDVHSTGALRCHWEECPHGAECVHAHKAGALRQQPEAALHQWRRIETVPHDTTVILANFDEACLLTGAPHVWTATYVTQWCDLKTGKPVNGPSRWNECSHAAMNENGEPTHWMPLPERPKTASGSHQDARSNEQGEST